MNYFKKFIFSLKEIIIVYIIQYLVVMISSVIYHISNGENIQNFILTYVPYILLIANILIIIFLFKKYYHKEKKLTPKIIIPLILSGIFLATFLNMILFLFQSAPNITTLPVVTIIISTAIIGPILEELLFRYIYLNNLLKFNTETNAIMINTVIFSMLHGSLYNMLYAFIIGLILCKIYLKYKNIYANIIFHMSANLIVIFLSSFNIYLLIVSIIGVLISYFLINKYTPS